MSWTKEKPMGEMPMKVLLIEDNPGDARLLDEVFSESAMDIATVTHVETMGEAEKHMSEHATDLIVLDLGLPDAQGLEAVQRTHAAAPVVPLVVLTGLDNEAVGVQALQAGAHEFLVKGQIEPRGILRALYLAIEREGLQRDLTRQQHELERSNADLEQFAYAASHDLNAPLRAIAHLVEWIEEDVRSTASPDTIDNLKLLERRVTRLRRLVNGMLAYARIGRIDAEVEDVDIAEVVNHVTCLLEFSSGLIVSCEGEMFPIRTYRSPIHMVLKNLITNALQHHDRAEGHIAVSMRMLDGMAEIRVSDDGPGIPARYRERIFVIFQTLVRNDDSESNGIGLAMVKKQVIENGGDIWIEGDPLERGATFVFTWKLAGPEPAAREVRQ
jgi:signal transduction histidine kinase